MSLVILIEGIACLRKNDLTNKCQPRW